MDAPGSLVGREIDQYRLLRQIGTGGYGVVYEAEHLIHKTCCAIKVLSLQLNEENIPDFIAEAKAVLLEHPHIMRIRGFGIDQSHPFFVMNYAQHGNLRKRHASHSILPWETVVRYVKEVGDALQYIHDQGLVHRDVKPQNMLIGDNGEILLSDFGLTITSYTIRPRLQPAAGTAPYVAPEQMRGQAVRASDQYALGAIMYEWLTGRTPFQGTASEVLYQHQVAKPTPLRQLNPALSQEVEALVMRTLEKDPLQRFASMREFLVAIEQIQSPHPIVRSFQGHTHAVQALAWAPSGQYIASAGHDKTVQVWDAVTKQTIYVYHGHTGDVWSVMWSPDSRYLVSAGAGGAVQVWEATTGYPFRIYEGHQGIVRSAAWSPTGPQIAFAFDETACIWDLQLDQVVLTYDGHIGEILALAWSPDGSYLASAGTDSVVRVWYANTGTHLHTYREHIDRVTALAWSPDSQRIASVSDDTTLQIWHARTGTQQQKLTGHSQAISSIAWSPDGRRLATGSWDQTVRTWHATQGSCLHLYDGHRQWVNAVTWSPDSRSIASASWDRTVHVFVPDDLANEETRSTLIIP